MGFQSPVTFNSATFIALCDRLGQQDADLTAIISRFGYPPMWSRSNSFESLVHIILEQQVSLASALAALNKLREFIGEITPENVLPLTDTDFRACYFSRQKTIYTRHLANAIVHEGLDLAAFEQMQDESVRSELLKLKGVGNWTVDIYLIFVLKRPDIFPPGDLVAMNALRAVKKLSPEATREDLIALSGNWKPYRTIATMLLWHHYLGSRAKKDQ